MVRAGIVVIRKSIKACRTEGNVTGSWEYAFMLVLVPYNVTVMWYCPAVLFEIQISCATIADGGRVVRIRTPLIPTAYPLVYGIAHITFTTDT
jgi:hypothetical protein